MKKKFMCMLMAAAMTLSMAACGSKGDDANNDANAGGACRRCPDLHGRHLRPADRRQRDLRRGRQAGRGARHQRDQRRAAATIKFEFSSQDDEADGEKAVNAYNNLMD